jgi:transcriptional regulator with XRE-family HTH domain
MNNYTDIIRGLREDRDLKQIELASVLGTTQQYYSKYETGEHELPIRALILLADYYGVSTDYILGRIDYNGCESNSKESITAEYSTNEAISEIRSLSAAGRATVMEFILFMNMRENAAKKKKKDGESQ